MKQQSHLSLSADLKYVKTKMHKNIRAEKKPMGNVKNSVE